MTATSGHAQIIVETYNNGSPTPEFNNAGQIFNHDFYWESISPEKREHCRACIPYFCSQGQMCLELLQQLRHCLIAKIRAAAFDVLILSIISSVEAHAWSTVDVCVCRGARGRAEGGHRPGLWLPGRVQEAVQGCGRHSVWQRLGLAHQEQGRQAQGETMASTLMLLTRDLCMRALASSGAGLGSPRGKDDELNVMS